MRVVLQRVKDAAVLVDGEEIARIGKGLLVFAGVEKGDSLQKAGQLAQRIARLRIFEDPQGKMNLSVQSLGAECLVVPQFTLVADVQKGNRPSFDPAEDPQRARLILEDFVTCLQGLGVPVKQGRFGARMQVRLINDGPVTFVL